MSEIKLNDAFQHEVAAFMCAGEGLNKDFSFGDLRFADLSLTTVDAYFERMEKLFRLVGLYANLVGKDVKDMNELAAQLKAADECG